MSAGSELDPYMAFVLRAVMRRMPGAAALNTTHDPVSDRQAGLAAFAMTPISMDLPSILIAVDCAVSARMPRSTASTVIASIRQEHSRPYWWAGVRTAEYVAGS